MLARTSPLLALPLAVAALGCADPTFPMPMTAAELVRYPPGPALTAYLSQRDATPAVCDFRARGPHLAALDDDARGAFVDGLTSGKIDPELWQRCAGALLNSAPKADAAALVDTIAREYRSIVKSSDFEKSPALQARVSAMQHLYIERRSRPDGDVTIADERIADLRRALAEGRLSPAAVVLGQDLVATVDLEHGLWHGRAVDMAAIDGLFAKGDEAALTRFAARLPNPDLRDEARRRVIRIHVAASPFPEVRAAASDVEEVLMKWGKNRIAIAAHPPQRGWFDASKMQVRGVLVRQDVWRQTAKLLGYSGDRPGVSVLPEVKLRDAILMEAKGISRPVTLCAPAKDLDPSPCIDAEDVKLENPYAYLDKGGAFRFVDNITMHDAVAMMAGKDKFVLPVSVGGQRLLSFDWRLSYERPENLVLTGQSPGNVGPDLRVSVDHRDPARFLFTVSAGGRGYLAVLEAPDAPAYRVSSRGAQGTTGNSGSAGSSGPSGGECQNGGRGGDGGPGGPGGPGGDGGAVAVDLRCDAACADAYTILSHIVLSEGGPGGEGGSGGPGGPGGAGGPSRSPRTHIDSNGNTVTDDPGCSAGSSGPRGSAGPSGSPGSPGHAGRVVIQMAR